MDTAIVETANAIKAKWCANRATYLTPAVIAFSLIYFVSFKAVLVFLAAAAVCKIAPFFLSGEGLRNLVPAALKALWNAARFADSDGRYWMFGILYAVTSGLLAWLITDPVYIAGGVFGLVFSMMIKHDQFRPIRAVIFTVIGAFVSFVGGAIFLAVCGILTSDNEFHGVLVAFPHWWPATLLLSGLIGAIASLPFSPRLLEFVTALLGYEVERVERYGEVDRVELHVAGSRATTPAQ